MGNLTGASNMLPAESASACALRVGENLVTDFERLLASELHLLKTGQSDGLEAIAQAKNELIKELAVEEQQLIALFENFPQQVDVKSLKDRLAQCRRNNSSNHALVMIELKHTNRSLEFLRSVLNMDDLALYSERGNIRVNREKRKLGSA